MKKTKNDGLEIYRNNLNLLQIRYPDIAERVKNCPININYEMRPSGSKRLINIYCMKLNKFYYDEEDPFKVIKEEIDQFDHKNSKISLHFGFGLGYQLEYFSKNWAVKSGTQFIMLIEKDVELFKIAMHMYDYRPLIHENKITLLIGEKTEDLFIKFEAYFQDSIKVLLLKAFKPIYLDTAFSLDKEYYMKTLKQFIDCGLYSIRFFGNSPEDSIVGLQHVLKNIEVIIKNPGINQYYDKFKGKPAIVVATGPSLDKNKHLLKGLEDKALIISADASLRILMKMGVKPHLVTTLERFEETTPMFAGYEKEQVENVYMAACPVIDDRTFETFPGPKIMVYRDFEHFRWIGIDKGILSIKQSSGNMAFKVAEALGCDPIIIIGQDFAYSRDGKTHAQENVYGDVQKELTEGTYYGSIFEVPGNDGMPILTNSDWTDFRKGYEKDVEQYKGRAINCTEGGAYINGTTVMSFSEAIEKHIKENINPAEILKRASDAFTVENEKADLLKVSEIIKTTLDDVYLIQKYCMEGFDKITEYKEQFTKAFESPDGTVTEDEKLKITEFFHDLMKIKTKSLNVEPTFQKFVLHIFQPYYIKTEIDYNEIASLYEEDYKVYLDLILKHERFFVIYHEILKESANTLIEAMNRINTINSIGYENISSLHNLEVSHENSEILANV